MAKTAVGSGQFEQSFMFHMIRDFFLLAMLVAAVELGIRYAALRYDFSRQEPARVDRAAQQLANDVKAIMLNSGGPLAAQTVYPILNRNYDDLGLSIAVLPSALTVESMRVSFKIEALGLQPRWQEGPHQQATASLQAEQFCLNCHIKAKVGDVLGTVTVRSYLERKEAAWWQEVRLTAGALSLKILIHTIVLFLLLKVRMAPLITLRSTVSSLARGVMDLSPRASVNSADEFGELAQDLNHFLDRIGLVVHDLDRILGEVVAVGTRLGALNRGLEQHVESRRGDALRLLGDGAQRSLDTQLLAAREAGAFDALEQTLLQTLAALAPAPGGPGTAAPQLREQLARLRQSFMAVSDALKRLAPPLTVAEAQSAEYQAFAQSLREMALLEASMQRVAESGQQVLQRLARARPERLPDAAPPPEKLSP
jgi:HAMP domain-containing protein